MDPFHQCSADSVSLMDWVDRNPSDVDVALAPLEAQASDRFAFNSSQHATVLSALFPHVRLGFDQCLTGRVQPGVRGEGALCQAVKLTRLLRPAERYDQVKSSFPYRSGPFAAHCDLPREKPGGPGAR